MVPHWTTEVPTAVGWMDVVIMCTRLGSMAVQIAVHSATRTLIRSDTYVKQVPVQVLSYILTYIFYFNENSARDLNMYIQITYFQCVLPIFWEYFGEEPHIGVMIRRSQNIWLYMVYSN